MASIEVITVIRPSMAVCYKFRISAVKANVASAADLAERRRITQQNVHRCP